MGPKVLIHEDASHRAIPNSVMEPAAKAE